MSKGIREEIEKYKSENGNANFTNKEMLWCLMGRMDKTDDKIDKIYEKFGKGASKIASLRTGVESLEKSDSRLWKFIYGLIFVILGLAAKVVWPT